MDRLPLKLIAAVAALIAGSSLPAAAQTFEYSPYKGFNNTGGQPTDPPPDSYTPTHQGPAPGVGGAAAPPYQAGESNSDAYQSSGATPPPAANGSYSSPRGHYSPSEDVFSPSRNGGASPPPPTQPPRGVGGPPIQDVGAMPRIEVQASAPDDGVPLSVRQDDARRAAIQGWRSKVADRYGPEFSEWRSAAGKSVDCHRDRRNGVVCIASAQPVRGFDRDNPWAAQNRRY
ncbi:MAG: hypothetical protein JSR78_04795 [Proteobacteria bacterium]|nr:hypothetical protein [Pseudomonadota bacterium]